MRCTEVWEAISAYIDGELDEGEKLKIEEHLQGCEDCRRQLYEMQAVASACRALGMEEPPPDFHERLKTRLASKRTGHLSRLAAVWSTSRYKGLAVAAVLIIALASGTLWQMVTAPMGSSVRMDESSYGLAPEEALPEMERADSVSFDETPRDKGYSKVLSSPQLGTVASFDRKIIKSANVQMEIQEEDFSEAQQAVGGITQSVGGFIQESTRWEAPHGANARFVLRVPENSFMGVLEELSKLGKVTSENVGGQDITEEYVDIESRLNSLRVHESRLLDILAKAQNVDELLRIESELSRIRSEIESLTGRLNYLGSLVAMSTIEVNMISVKEVTPKEPTLWDEVVAAFLRTVRALADMATRTLVFLSSAAPVLLVLAVVWYLIKRRR